MRDVATFPSLEADNLPGVRQTVQVPQPAATTLWSYVLPGGYYYRPLVIATTFAGSAVAGTRFLAVAVTTDEGVVFTIPAASSVSANQTWQLSWVTGFPSSINNSAMSRAIQPFPAIWLPPGSVVASFWQSYQTGDQWSGVSILFECWDYGPRGEAIHVHPETEAEAERFNPAGDHAAARHHHATRAPGGK